MARNQQVLVFFLFLVGTCIVVVSYVHSLSVEILKDDVDPQLHFTPPLLNQQLHQRVAHVMSVTNGTLIQSSTILHERNKAITTFAKIHDNAKTSSKIQSSTTIDANTTALLLSKGGVAAENNMASSVRLFVQRSHLDQFGAKLARPFENQPPYVCSIVGATMVKDNSEEYIYKEPLEGLFYVKMPKAASSTLAGVNARIAIRQGARRFGNHSHNTSYTTATAGSCTHLQHHLRQAGKWYGNRDHDRSFLWASLRDPASRALSRLFFWHISQGKKYNSTDEHLIHLLKMSTNRQLGAISNGQGGFQLKYLAFERLKAGTAWDKSEPTVVLNPEVIQRSVKQVIDDYDFIALTERMDESLVALQLLLDLPVGDILSVSAKVSGNYVVTANKNLGKFCVPIQKTVRSPAVHEYLTSDRWYAVNYGDYLLHSAANISLDLTIERLGKDRFHKALQTFKHAQKLVRERCDAKAHFPCSSNGTAQLELSSQSCYQEDEGCGHGCIDELCKDNDW